jgi:Xaa-Pro aminopeptidase
MFTGKDATRKLIYVRDWIKNYTPSSGTSKNSSSPSQRHVGTLVTNLASIGWFAFCLSSIVCSRDTDAAYVLNLRGDDIPFNPVFVSYMYIGLDRAIVFVEQEKIEPPVREYLQNLKVEIREYNGIWSFLRTREWGEGKVRTIPISPQ